MPPTLCNVATGRASLLGGYDLELVENATLLDDLRLHLAAALTSMQDEPRGWASVVQPAILPEHVTRIDNETVRIELMPMDLYSIDRPETLTLVIPPELVTSNQLVTATFGTAADAAGLRVQPEMGNATLSGSFVSRATRADVRSIDEYVLTISLGGGEEWEPTVGRSDVECMFGDGECASAALLRGVTSARAQPRGWEAVLGAGLSYLDLERRDDSTVDLAIDARFASYFINTPETLSLAIPAASVKSDAPLQLADALVVGVNATNGRAELGGSFLQRTSLVETAVQLRDLVLEVNLVDDTWVESLSEETVAAIVSGVSAAPLSPYGWDSVVQPALTSANVVRVNDTVLTITFRHESYDLEYGAPELLSVIVPPVAVASSVAHYLSPSLRVEPVTCSVSLGGTLAASPDAQAFLLHAPRGVQESALRGTNGTLLIVRLHGCTWRFDTHGGLAHERMLIDGITSAQSEPQGFAAIVLATLRGELIDAWALWNATNSSYLNATPAQTTTPARGLNTTNTSAVAVVNASAVAIHVPALPYDITAPETITVVVNEDLVAFDAAPINAPTFEIAVVGGSAQLVVHSERLAPRRASGALAEESVQVLLNRLVIVLTDDTWTAQMGSDCHLGQEVSATWRLLRQLRVAQTEPYGFNTVIAPLLSCEHVFRNSSTVTTVMLPPAPSYDITMPETMEVLVPAAAVTSGQAISAQPPLVISPSSPQVVLGGSFLTPSGLTELAISTPVELELVISLLGATWLEPPAWSNPTNQQLILEGIRSLQPELLSGWESAVRPSLFAEDVQYVDGTTLTVRIRQVATYSILRAETIRIEVPAGVTRTLDAPIHAQPLLVIRPSAGDVALNGSLLGSLTEAQLHGSESSLEVQLLHDEWISDEDRLAGLLRAGLRSVGTESGGFNSVLQPMLEIQRRSDTLVSIHVPPSNAYAIGQPDALSLTVPMDALASARGASSTFDMVVVPEAGSVVLSDANSPGALYLYLDTSETDIRAIESVDLQLALSGDTFSRDVGEDTNASRLLIDSFRSVLTGARSWNRIVQRTMTYTNLIRVDNTHVRIAIPQCADYDITAPETIMISLPGDAFASGKSPSLLAAGPAGQLVINASQGSSQLSGTLLADANVASIQSPVENTITIRLQDVDFAPALFSSPTMQSNLARSLATRVDESAASALLDVEPFGWNAIVRPGLSYDNVQFVAGARQAVNIRIPQFAAYQISSPEIVSVVIPAESLLGGITPLRAEPAFIIEAPQAMGLFGGTLLRNVGEDDLRTTANYTLSVTLSGDEWAAGIGEPCADESGVTSPCVTTSMVSNLVATSSSTAGWNRIVRGSLPVSAVRLEAATQKLTITFPAYPEYEIESPEIITLTLPATSTVSGNRIFVSPAFRIRAASGGASISGRALGRVTEEDLRENGGIVFEIDLHNDTFTPLVGHRHVNPIATEALLSGMRSAQHEPAGWNAIVSPKLARLNVMRDSTTHTLVTIPVCPTYEISEPETITVAIPPEAVSSAQILQAGTFIVQANAGYVTLMPTRGGEELYRDASGEVGINTL